MAATDAAPDLAEQVARFQLRRTWPQLLTMFFGGCVALTGIASVASHVVHQDEELALPMVTAVALYVAGGAAFAWGGARFAPAALPKWLAITLVSGSLFVLLAFAAGLLSSIANNVLGRAFGPKGKTTLAVLLVDRSEVATVIGSPVEGPANVGSPARSSSVVWTGPAGTTGARPTMTVNVRHSATRAARVRSQTVEPPVTRIADDCLLARRDTSTGEVVSVVAARGTWVVTMSTHGRLVADPQPALLRLVSAALDRLSRC